MNELDFIFKSGEEGYSCFRIPAIVKSEEGTLLAFAEGRVAGCSDTGRIHLVLKRSRNQGETWGPLQVVWKDRKNCCGNPAPVVDRTNGDIILLSTWNLGDDRESEIIAGNSTDTRRVFMLKSADDGLTWSEPREITQQVKRDNWTWYATGPVHGIQLRNGPQRGRLIIPCDHMVAVTREYRSHVIYSDDHGSTWSIGGIVPQDQVNECTIAELDDGRLILNMRNYDRREKNRKISYSRDWGLSWSDIQSDPVLIEPVCQGSMLLFRRRDQAGILLFLNPGHQEKRINMTLRYSLDQGRSWVGRRIIHPGPSAYSDLVQVSEREILLLIEGGVESPYEGIAVKGLLNLEKIINEK